MKVKEKNLGLLKGQKCILRPLEDNDINKTYLSWLNDRRVTRYMETGKSPVTFQKLRKFYHDISRSKKDVIFAVTDRKEGIHIGNIKLGNINHVHKYADLGVMIGDRRCWGKGYGTDACRVLLGYAFDTLKLNKVILGVYGTHTAAIRAYKRAGFRIEGRIRELLYLNGKYHDKVAMGISRAQFIRTRK